MGRRDIVHGVAPHSNSPFIIDICFSDYNKCGIVLYSGRQLLRSCEDGKWSVVDSGSTRLMRKILKASDWKVSYPLCLLA